MTAGLCECGCGAPAPLAKRTEMGNRRGHPQRFIRGHGSRGRTSAGGAWAHIPQIDRFWSRVTRSDGCWLWTGGKTTAGYGPIKWDGRPDYAHRVAYRLMVGEIPAGLRICHHCDNPPCCNPAHLFLGTDRENSLDMVAKGRAPRGMRPGERCGEQGAHKLTTEQVLEIKRRYAAGGITTEQLGREYGVRGTTVTRIMKGTRWQHLNRLPKPKEGA